MWYSRIVEPEANRQSTLTHRYYVLSVLCITFIFHQAICNGFPSVIYRTLETAYGLSSWQVGIVSSSYEIADTVVCVFVIHIISKYSKPVSTGIGLIFAALGGMIFCIPQLLSEVYNPGEEAMASQCTLGGESIEGQDCTDNSKMYGFNKADLNYGLFVLGMLIVGAGSVPMHSFVPTYIDENVDAKEVPMYHSIWLSLGILGPAIGFIGGGALLKIPTDFYRVDNYDNNPVQSDNTHPVFVGAWWIGILGSSILLFLAALVTICLPKRFNTSTTVLNQESTTDDEIDETLWGTTKVLFSNKIWVLTCAANSCDAFLIQVCAGFAIRHLALTFRLNNSSAAMIGGAMIIVSAVLGQVTSGLWLRRIESNKADQILTLSKATFIGPTFSFICSFIFIVTCVNPTINAVDFTKKSHQLEFTSTPSLIDSTCVNSNCPNPGQFYDCDIANYSPICDKTSKVSYFSSCFAGCDADSKNCACLPDFSNTTESNTTDGLCDSCSTSKIVLFCAAFTILLASVFWNFIPYMQLCLRSVPFRQRSQAMAWWSVISRLLGSIPGPIAFGALLDTACVIWEPPKADCFEGTTVEGALGSCMLFDSGYTSWLWLSMLLITRVLCAISLWFLYYFAKKNAQMES